MEIQDEYELNRLMDECLTDGWREKFCGSRSPEYIPQVPAKPSLYRRRTGHADLQIEIPAREFSIDTAFDQEIEQIIDGIESWYRVEIDRLQEEQVNTLTCYVWAGNHSALLSYQGSINSAKRYLEIHCLNWIEQTQCNFPDVKISHHTTFRIREAIFQVIKSVLEALFPSTLGTVQEKARTVMRHVAISAMTTHVEVVGDWIFMFGCLRLSRIAETGIDTRFEGELIIDLSDCNVYRSDVEIAMKDSRSDQ